MYLVSCPTNCQITENIDFSGDLAEIIEMKLLGIDTINGKEWDDYAADMLQKYHQSIDVTQHDYKPLWRTLYEEYCRLDKSYSPNVVFMQLIRVMHKRLSADFPLEEISRKMLIDYLDKEAERAMSCE